MVRTLWRVPLWGLLLAAAARAEPDSLVGVWRPTDVDPASGMDVLLDLQPDGRFELTAQALVTGELLEDPDLLGGELGEDGLLDSGTLEAFPGALQAEVQASGTWTAQGDQLLTRIEELDLEVWEPDALRLGLDFHLVSAEGLELVAHLLLDEALMDELTETADEDSTLALPEDVALPDSLDLWLHAALSWQLDGDMVEPATVEALEVRINGLDLGEFIAQNPELATAVVEAMAADLALDLGVPEEDLAEFQAEMVRAFVTEFDPASFQAGIGMLLAGLFDPTSFQADLVADMSGAYRVEGSRLSLSDETGDVVSEWTRVSAGSPVAATSWGQLKAGRAP
ncbi:MAG: hypothetical protein AB1505_21685 [Candidatus Latescibacterota bacterium]